MGQVAVKACYTKGAQWVRELNQYIYQNMVFVRNFVQENFPKATFVEPEGTYLVWIDFSGYGLTDEELEQLVVDDAKLWLELRENLRTCNCPSLNGSTWLAPKWWWNRLLPS